MLHRKLIIFLKKKTAFPKDMAISAENMVGGGGGKDVSADGMEF